MTIEAYIIQYLGSRLTVPVSGDIPEPLPETFVTVEQTGGEHRDKIRHATIAVQSWSTSRANAAALDEEVIQILEAATGEPEISRCALDSHYNFTDLSRKKPRYQAVFDVVYYL